MSDSRRTPPLRKAPDSLGLAIARDIQEQLPSAEVILLGSRAVDEHRPDSYVDLMAVCQDDVALSEADETLGQLLEGRYDVPVVKVITATREEFQRTAALAQSQARQAARHGVILDGRSLDYKPEREPEPEEIREAAILWLVLAEIHLDGFSVLSGLERLARSHIPALEAQTALERAFKGLLTASKDGARF